MKKMTKFLSLALALVMLIGVMPMAAFADEGDPVTHAVVDETPADAHGHIVFGSFTVIDGENLNVKVYPDDGYKISKFFVNDEEKTLDENRAYVVENVTADVRLKAEFEEIVADPIYKGAVVVVDAPEIGKTFDEFADIVLNKIDGTTVKTAVKAVWSEKDENDLWQTLPAGAKAEANKPYGVDIVVGETALFLPTISKADVTINDNTPTNLEDLAGNLGLFYSFGKLSTTYAITENAKWGEDQHADLTFTIAPKFSKVEAVKIDGVAIDAKNYTVKEDKVSLADEFLRTLGVKTHSVEIVLTDGSVTGSFEVKEHVCKIAKVSAKKATCTEDGYKEYYECKGCGEKYADAEGKTVISEKTFADKYVVAKTGHKFETKWSTNGKYHWHKCTQCSEVKDKAVHTVKNEVCTVCKAEVDNPITADNIGMWIAIMIVSGLGLVAVATKVVIDKRLAATNTGKYSKK